MPVQAVFVTAHRAATTRRPRRRALRAAGGWMAALAALAGLGCPQPVVVVPPPSATLTAAPCVATDCGADDRVVTVRGSAVSGALVTATVVARTRHDGEPIAASTTATTAGDVAAGRARAEGLYEVVLGPVRDDAGAPLVPRRGDRVQVYQLVDDGTRIARSNPIDLELLVP